MPNPFIAPALQNLYDLASDVEDMLRDAEEVAGTTGRFSWGSVLKVQRLRRLSLAIAETRQALIESGGE